ncbi:hypothetical protein ACQH8B_26170 [Klebsiella pneumoniae]
MTDITELAQSLKAAAEHYQSVQGIARYSKTADAKERFLELANPANILALVEALEKAQQVDEELCRLLPPGAEYMDPPDGGDVTPLEGVRRMVADYRQRIAELESRTVKLPDLRQIVSGDRYVWSDGVYNYSQDVKVTLAAAGIKVEAE